MPARGPMSQEHREALSESRRLSSTVTPLPEIAAALNCSRTCAGNILASALEKAGEVLRERGLTAANLLDLDLR